MGGWRFVYYNGEIGQGEDMINWWIGGDWNCIMKGLFEESELGIKGV